MRILGPAATATIAFVLAACATQTQLQVGHAVSALTDASAKSDACFAAVGRDPEIGILEQRGALSGEPTLANLSDANHVSASEVEALLKVDAKRRPCRQIVLDAYQQNAPLYVPLHIKYFQDVDAVTVDLNKLSSSHCCVPIIGIIRTYVNRVSVGKSTES